MWFRRRIDLQCLHPISERFHMGSIKAFFRPIFLQRLLGWIAVNNYLATNSVYFHGFIVQMKTSVCSYHHYESHPKSYGYIHGHLYTPHGTFQFIFWKNAAILQVCDVFPWKRCHFLLICLKKIEVLFRLSLVSRDFKTLHGLCRAPNLNFK